MIGRYSVPITTRAGIDWVKGEQTWQATPVKMLLGLAAIDWEPDQLDQWYTIANQRRLHRLVATVCPEAYSDLKAAYTGDNFGKLLATRAAYCVPPTIHHNGKNELARFMKPEYSSTLEALRKQEKLSNIRLLELQENRILLALPEDQIGVYLRSNPDQPRDIYAGIARDIIDRNSGHLNSTLFLMDVRACEHITTAKEIEKKVHDFLREIGEPYRNGTRGLFRVNQGNALELVRAFLDKYYRGFFHNTVATY